MARRRLIFRLALGVVLVHALALEWLRGELSYSTVLRPVVPPMYTRLLRPETPALPPPAPAAAEAAVQPPPPPRELRARLAQAPTARRKKAAASAPAAPTETAGAPLEPAALPTEPLAPAQAETTVAQAEAAPPPEPAASAASAAAVAASSPASAAQRSALDTWPSDTRLSYRLGGKFRSGDLYGDARVLWQRQDSAYQVQVDVDVTLFATLVMTSQGEVTPEGLAPRAYEELRRNKRRAARLGERTLELEGGRSLPRPAGVQDTASQFVELAHRFASGRERLEVGRTVSFWMARPGAVDYWTYDIVRQEVLNTPQLGAVEAFHLKPRPIANPRGNITAEMWFAPALQYLPVRIRVSMGDEAHVDLIVERIEQR